MKNLYTFTLAIALFFSVTTLIAQEFNNSELALNTKENVNDSGKKTPAEENNAKAFFVHRQLHITESEDHDYTLNFEMTFNAATDQLSVYTLHYLEDYKVSLFNLRGELIETKSLSEMVAEFDLSKLMPSVYFLDISDKDYKLIKSFKLEKYFKGYF